MKINISFVIPVYNKTIEQVKNCILSIKKIQIKANYEILIIDDGSNADLSEAYKKFSQKNSIQYFYQKNQGVSKARNKGIDKAKGEYIYFIDADDVLIPSNFKSIKENMYKFDLIIYDVKRLNTNLNREKVERLDVKGNNPSVKSLRNFLIKDSLLNWAIGKLYRRNFLIKNNIKFNSNKKVGEDFDFVVKVLNAQPQILYIRKATYLYLYNDATGIHRDIVDPKKSVENTEDLKDLRLKILSTMNDDNNKKSENAIYNDRLKSIFEIYAHVVHFDIKKAQKLNNFFTQSLYKKYRTFSKPSLINSIKRFLVKAKIYLVINMYIISKQTIKKVYKTLNSN